MKLGEYLKLFEGLDPELPVFVVEDRSSDTYPMHDDFHPNIVWLWPHATQHPEQGEARYDWDPREEEAPRKSVQGIIL